MLAHAGADTGEDHVAAVEAKAVENAHAGLPSR